MKKNDRDKAQISLDFRPGLVRQFPDWKDLIAHTVYSCSGGLNAVAIRCDRSPSLMSRMLNKNPDDQRHLPIEDLVPILEETKDYRPIFWLIERFLEDPGAKEKRAREELIALLPQLQRLVEQFPEK